MTVTVKKIAFPEHAASSHGQLISESHLDLIGGVEVACSVRVGTLSMTIAELGQLKEGQTLSLEEKTQEPVDILLNNHVVARGELMSCGENFAIQITELCS